MAPQREWFEKDYYKVLGVPEGAPEKDVSRAYKKLAKQFHPDANPGNKEAEERFKEISAAYDVVGDTAKRKEYDEVRRMVASGVGPGGPGGFGAGGQTFNFEGGDIGDLGGLFGNLFGGGGRRGRRAPAGPQRGQDLETELHLGQRFRPVRAEAAIEAERCLVRVELRPGRRRLLRDERAIDARP